MLYVCGWKLNGFLGAGAAASLAVPLPADDGLSSGDGDEGTAPSRLGNAFARGAGALGPSEAAERARRCAFKPGRLSVAMGAGGVGERGGAETGGSGGIAGARSLGECGLCISSKSSLEMGAVWVVNRNVNASSQGCRAVMRCDAMRWPASPSVLPGKRQPNSDADATTRPRPDMPAQPPKHG